MKKIAHSFEDGANSKENSLEIQDCPFQRKEKETKQNNEITQKNH